ncbi:glycosyltransferase [Pseudomonas sp. UMAB-08]|uniref:glycosyltransferase n=1 Tax=Pseudomonas sp. UMAB-08 TaxID=1365375 RepID=UPI001C55EC12|nr:glycosyltransferase [Pseudomonas sp. UMAB-08]
MVRYILNREGFLTGNSVEATEDDLFFYYAHDFRDDSIQTNMLTLPVIDSELFSPPSDPVVRTKSYLYLHRYAVNNVDFSLLPADIEILSLSNPKTLSQLADVFKTAHVLYSYEISATCTEAMLCGCPVIYLKGGHIETLPFTEHFGEAGSAMYDEPGGYERAKATVLDARARWLDIETTFWSQFEHFVALTQQAVKHYQDTGHSRPLRDWLKARTLTPMQSQLVAERRRILQDKTSITAIVLHASGDSQALQATLSSLANWQSQTTRLRSVVLSEETPPDDVSPDIEWLPYPHELAVQLNAILESDSSDWFILLNAGDEFLSNGTLMLELELPGAAHCRMVYFDEIHRYGENRGVVLRPDINLDYLLSFPVSMARHWLFRRQYALEAGGLNSELPHALEFDLILRMIERDGLDGIGHVGEPLLVCNSPTLENNPDEITTLQRHLIARGYPQSEVIESPSRHYHVQYGHTEQPMVSIVIPTKDQLPMLERCVETLLEKTAYSHYEILIVDNGSQTPEARQWLANMEAIGGQKIRILRYPNPFNFSAMNNMAVREARGEYLVLLNNDTAILRDDWLDKLLNHALRPEVGIVGAKLLYPNATIQHAGVITGLRGPADHPFIGEPGSAPGYMQRRVLDQNYSAVTAACMMIRKSVYEEVGGMDEGAFKVAYNDVDLCLKVGALGYLTVWTPHALLLHEGSVSQNAATPNFDEKRKRFVQEQDAMYAKWLPTLAKDPAYNRNLSLNGGGFGLETNANLTWRPLSWRPLPVVLAHPADTMESGNYRIIMPFEAMRDAGLIDGFTSQAPLSVVDLERYSPDVIVLHRHINDERLEVMRRVKAFSPAFKVYDLDDDLLNLPTRHTYCMQLPTDVMKALAEGLSFVDRFVVSTPYMADLFAGLHPDIRIVENRLPAHLWQSLSAERQRGKKPRVGCVTDVDLHLIEDVIKQLANDVEWVLMGKCPEHLRAFAREIYGNIEFSRHPAALASLNLDLALAPLEQTLFNDCKGNLRVIEYGACGFPVICSDVRAYQGDLPVTLVQNTTQAWLEAIHAHLDDKAASARLGGELRTKVLSEWMLDASNAVVWRDAWLPD